MNPVHHDQARFVVENLGSSILRRQTSSLQVSLPVVFGGVVGWTAFDLDELVEFEELVVDGTVDGLEIGCAFEVAEVVILFPLEVLVVAACPLPLGELVELVQMDELLFDEFEYDVELYAKVSGMPLSCVALEDAVVFGKTGGLVVVVIEWVVKFVSEELFVVGEKDVLFCWILPVCDELEKVLILGVLIC